MLLMKYSIVRQVDFNANVLFIIGLLILAGVPQGNLLDIILFFTYINSRN